MAYGHFHFLPKVSRPSGFSLGDTLGRIPLLGDLFAGPIPASGASRLAASLNFDHHDHSHHCGRQPGCLPGNSRFTAGGIQGARCHRMGNHLAGADPVRRSGTWAQSFWALGVHWERPWLLPWLSATAFRAGSPCCKPATAWPVSSLMNSPRRFPPLHTAALLEIGFKSCHHNAALEYRGPFLVWQVAARRPKRHAYDHFAELMERNRVSRSRKRKAANAAMLSLTGLLTALALVPLFWIIGYVVLRGGKNINLDFSSICRARWDDRRGVLSAIEGTLVYDTGCSVCIRPVSWLPLCSQVSRIPRWECPALSARTSCREFHPLWSVFAYAAIVVPMGHYSDWQVEFLGSDHACQPSSARLRKC